MTRANVPTAAGQGGSRWERFLLSIMGPAQI
ncbi:MAG: hypothetical protein JWO22_1784, partial [Frankiales bacterium]|nr:hypothetical protein [Frankiales bacterium]